jgi:4'-phosphopantetheinyl transferase
MHEAVRIHRIRVSDGLAHAALLSQDELARAGRFRFQADRDRFIAGRGATRWLVGRALGMAPADLSFGEGPHGKPFVRGAAGFSFNRSHSGDWVLVALGDDREVGIDVEYARPDIDVLELGGSVLSAGELSALAALRDAAQRAAFYQVWARKEAVLKAWGVGLYLEPRDLDVGVAGASRRIVPARGAAHEALTVEDVEVDATHTGAVAWVG